MRPIVDNLTPPVDLDRHHWRDGERATVTLVEYADDGCPYSRMAFRAIQRLKAATRRPATIRYSAPSPHPHPSHALTAAHLAEAAALQGNFWPVHELLFHHQKALQDPDLLRYADQLGLDRRLLEVEPARLSGCGSRPTPTAH